MKAECQEGGGNVKFQSLAPTVPTQFSHYNPHHTPKKTGLTHRPHQSWQAGKLGCRLLVCLPLRAPSPSIPGGHMCWGVSLEATERGNVVLTHAHPHCSLAPAISLFHSELLTPKPVATWGQGKQLNYDPG